jgi:hypothetical protein
MMDNFYNSQPLAKLLKSQKTDCAGTLKLNRKNTPQTSEPKDHSTSGEVKM